EVDGQTGCTQLASRLAPHLGVHVDKADRRTFRAEFLDDGTSDAAGAARHERNPAGEAPHACQRSTPKSRGPRPARTWPPAHGLDLASRRLHQKTHGGGGRTARIAGANRVEDGAVPWQRSPGPSGQAARRTKAD